MLVSATAFALPDALADVSLWKLLSPAVCRAPSKRRASLPIADSKKLYSGLHGACGIEHLERGVLAMLGAWGKAPRTLEQLLALVSAPAHQAAQAYPWYAGQDCSLPQAVDAVNVALCGNAVADRMLKLGVSMQMMRSEVVFEGEFNRLVDAIDNKSTMLLGVTCRLLAELWQKYACGTGVPPVSSSDCCARKECEETHGRDAHATQNAHAAATAPAPGMAPLIVYVDRQGGRMRYLPTLQRLFEGARFTILDETDEISAYRVVDGESAMELQFCVGCEERHLAVALASMTSKYLRETFMGLFNRFWATHMPTIAPTAGYYKDGLRFYKEIRPLVRELGFNEAMLYRTR
jgi:hypothetical protein